MHYKNGREAHNGDKIIFLPNYGKPVMGVLYDAVAGNDDCNGYIASIGPNDRCPDLKECLHLEDARRYIEQAESYANAKCDPMASSSGADQEPKL